ncbi:MAG TPA: DUF692 domain-containing protein [bacterium]|nr:DUF692 domain-containing protein [bacterium]
MRRSEIQNLGFGLGLRRENVDDLLAAKPSVLDCLEIAPENYMKTGGRLYRQYRELAERYPIVIHGLSLSLGSKHPPAKAFLKDLKAFLKQTRALWMSDHLCYSSVLGAQFHDLLPLPFSREALRHVVPRIRKIQDYLEMPFAVENVSYYAPGGRHEMTEWEFLAEVAERADCSLLLDVNNIYVNAVNHGFDPFEYLKTLPYERVLHIHVAGHIQYQNFLLDTHGAPVIDPVWDLLRYVAARAEPKAVIVERDHNLPPLSESLAEVAMARRIFQKTAAERRIA